MLIEPKPRKEYEKPKPGLHLGVLADVIYTEDVPTQSGPKNKARYVWILEKKDAEGNHFQARSKNMNRSTDPASDMYILSTSVQNGTPIPPSFDPESLLGKVNVLGIVHAPGVDKRTGKAVVYVNISSVNPAEETQKLAIPAGFIRDKDKDKTKRFGTQQAVTASVAASPAAIASGDDSDEIGF